MTRHRFQNFFIGLLPSLLMAFVGFSTAHSQTASEQFNESAAYEGIKSMFAVDSPSVKAAAEGLFAKIEPQALSGDARSQYYLGRMYVDGVGVRKDMPLAIYWFQKAAEQGSADSQFRLALLRKGSDNRAALFWLNESAGRGWGVAQYSLGLGYAEGTLGFGIAKDAQLAYFWLLLASTDGNKDAIFARDYVGDKMLTPDQRLVIQANVRAWRPKAARPVKYSATAESNPGAQSPTGQVDSTGSGFRIARGYFITNHHVIDGCSRRNVSMTLLHLAS